MHARPLLYSRPLPGGGFVAIDALAQREGAWHARLWVERRAESGRRSGHTPPIVLEAEDSCLDAAVDRLRQVADDNVALAQAIRQRRHEPGASSFGF